MCSQLAQKTNWGLSLSDPEFPFVIPKSAIDFPDDMKNGKQIGKGWAEGNKIVETKNQCSNDIIILKNDGDDFEA